MRARFIEHLGRIKADIRDIIERDRIAVQAFVEDIEKQKIRPIAEVQQYEEETHRLLKETEHSIMMLILRQQPVADDLHALTTSMAMHRDLARIAIQATESERLWHQVPAAERNQPLLLEMGQQVLRMVIALEMAYIQPTVAEIRQIIAMDDVIDDLFLKVKMQVVENIQGGNVNYSAQLDIVFISKYFEKMGDHLSAVARHELRLLEKEW